MKLYLLRHGESEGNREGRFRGRTDYALTERGMNQAESAGTYIKENYCIDAVYSSPMKRAVQTADTVCRLIERDFTIMDEFNNIKLGDWEGQSKEYIQEHYPMQWNIWLNDPRQLRIQGMETLKSISQRAMKGIEKISKTHDDNMLVVTHRAILKPLTAGLIGIKEPAFWKIHFDTAALTIIEWSEPAGWTLKNLNINHYLPELAEEAL